MSHRQLVATGLIAVALSVSIGPTEAQQRGTDDARGEDFAQAQRRDTPGAWLAYLRRHPTSREGFHRFDEVAFRDAPGEGPRFSYRTLVVPAARPLVDELIRLLPRLNADVRNSAVYWLGNRFDLWWIRALDEPLSQEVREKLVAGLVRRVGREDMPETFACESIRILGDSHDPRALHPLLSALHVKNYEARVGAAQALGHFGDARAIDQLAKRLQDPDGSVRLKVIWALGHIDDPATVAPLLEAAKRGAADATDRGYLAYALGGKKDPRATEALMRASRDEDAFVRQAAVVSLREIPRPRAVPALCRCLNDEETDVRVATAITLGIIKSPRAVKPLCAALKDKAVYVRVHAAEALGSIGDPQAAGDLAAVAVTDEDQRVIWAAEAALIRLGGAGAVEALLPLLKDDEESVANAAHRLLGRIPDPRAAQAFIAALKEDPPPDGPLSFANAESVHTNPCLIEPLIASLDIEDRTEREYIRSRVVTGFDDPQVAAALGRAVGDENALVRRGVAEVVKEHQDRHAEFTRYLTSPRTRTYTVVRTGPPPPLPDDGPVMDWLAALVKDRDVSVRQAAVAALAEAQNDRALKLLSAALGDDETSVRTAAVKAIGRFRDARAVKPLTAAIKNDREPVAEAAETQFELLLPIEDPQLLDAFAEALKDDHPRVRYRAARLLSHKRDPRALPALVTALKDSDDLIREQGALGLAALKDPRAVKPLVAALADEDSFVRAGAAFALGEIADAGAVPALLKSLKEDKAASVRRWAAAALGNIGDPRALEPLLAALKDGDSGVRGCALEALGSFHDPRTADLLLKHLKEPGPLRPYAAAGLGRLKDPRAVEPLIAALADESARVRQQASGALAELGDPRAVEPLLAELKNVLEKPNPQTYMPVMAALGELKDPRAVGPLADIADHNQGTVRQKAREAIRAILRSRPAGAIVTAPEHQSAVVRDEAAKLLLEGRNPEAVPPLLELLKKGDSRTRKAVISALAGVDDPCIIGPVTAVMIDNDESWEVRNAAVALLAKTKHPRAAAAFIEILHNPQRDGAMNKAAAEALAGMGPATVEAVARDLREHPSSAPPLCRRLASVGLEVDVRPLIAGLVTLDAHATYARMLLWGGWRPKTIDDVVHVFAAERRDAAMMALWPDTRRVMLRHLRSDDPATVEYAACHLIRLSQDETVPELIQALENKGNGRLAQMYFGSGNTRLRQAATAWAVAHGFTLKEDAKPLVLWHDVKRAWSAVRWDEVEGFRPAGEEQRPSPFGPAPPSRLPSPPDTPLEPK